MVTPANKAPETKSTAAHSAPKQQGGSASALFVDNRPQAVAQRKMQEAINESPLVKRLQAPQERINNSPHMQQVRAQQVTDNRTAVNQPKAASASAGATPVQLRQGMEPETVEEKPVLLQKKENNTGLPDQLKAGVENLSGLSMDDVKVHYNSDKPVELQAHAYAQGTDIHVAPGQEEHLPHEAWHVVQQKQGRVRPTMQLKGTVDVNDNAGLEKEADVMGDSALRFVSSRPATSTQTNLRAVAHGTDIKQPTALQKPTASRSGSSQPAVLIQRIWVGDDIPKNITDAEVIEKLSLTHDTKGLLVWKITLLRKHSTPYSSYAEIAANLSLKPLDSAAATVAPTPSLASAASAYLEAPHSFSMPSTPALSPGAPSLPSVAASPSPKASRNSSVPNAAPSQAAPRSFSIPSATATSSSEAPRSFPVPSAAASPAHMAASPIPKSSVGPIAPASQAKLLAARFAMATEPQARERERPAMIDTGRVKIFAPRGEELTVYRAEKAERNKLEDRRAQGGLNVWKSSSSSVEEAYERMLEKITKKDKGMGEDKFRGALNDYAQILRAEGQPDNLASARTVEGAYVSDHNYTISIPGVQLFKWTPSGIGERIAPGTEIKDHYIVLNAATVRESTIFGIGHVTGTQEVSFYSNIPASMIQSVRTGTFTAAEEAF